MNSFFKYGIVIDVIDNLDGDRVRVYIRGVDPPNYKKEDIPFAFPLIPKHIYLKPRIGETVMVFTQDGDMADDRFWIGPLISQPNKLDYDNITGNAFLKTGLISPGIPPSKDPENDGVQLSNEDIGIQGRGSTDISLKANEVRVRAGKSFNLRKLNSKNPTYMQLKFDNSKNEGIVNLVSNKINLLTHNGEGTFSMADKNELISSEELKKISEKAQSMPYGDFLVEFLNIIVKAITTHVHAYHGLNPDLTQIELRKLLEYDTNKILSKNIKIS